MRRKSFAVLSAVIITSAGMLVTNSPSAFAESAAAKAPAVISLGDSYISGEAGRWQGNGNTLLPGSAYGTDRAAYDCNSSETWCWHDPARVYGNSYQNGCNRSDSAEITHLESVRVGAEDYDIDRRNRINIACSGATAAAIYQDRFKGEPEQADQLARHARRTDIKLVVLSIGGNDIRFADMIRACATAFTTGSTHCNRTLEPVLSRRVERMRVEVTKAVDAVRSAMSNAGYDDSDYRFVLQSYSSPIPRSADNRYPATGWSRWTEGGCPFFDDDSDWANDTLVPAIGDALRGIARDAGTEFLDLRQALRGHEVCARSARQARDGNTLRNPLPEARSEWARWIGIPGLGQGETQEFLHPNVYGQQALGRCLSDLALGAGDLTCGNPG